MQDPRFVKRAFQQIADRYVLANHALSMGVDVHWRRKVASIVGGFDPARVLDLASGSGDLAAAVESKCPDSLVIGADFCQPMLAHARRRGLRELVVADGMRLPFGEQVFDVVTIGFGLRNMESWPGAVEEMARVIRGGGHLVVLDFSLPRSKLMRAAYRVYLHRVMPMVGGWITGKREAYDYLGGSIESFPSGDALMALLSGHGFQDARWIPLTGGIASIYVARRKKPEPTTPGPRPAL